MGRKTWTSIPAKFRPLANRINIVLSTAETLDLPEGVYHACCFDATLHLINNELYDKIDEVFVIGGSSVYELSMKSSHVSRIYHTEIYNEYDCDTFLPPFDRSKFDLLKDCEGVPSGIQEEADIKYEYKVYQSIQIKQ